MPERKTLKRARKARREGKAPTTQAGEFVREEMEHVREGKHGARSTKQAIAIGLSKARRAGVELRPPKKGQASARTRRSAERASRAGQSGTRRKPSARRSRATSRALKREPRRAASRKAVSKQARSAAARRRQQTAAGADIMARTHSRRSSSPRPKSDRPRAARKTLPRRWARQVAERSDALDLQRGVFTSDDPRRIASSLKRSAERSTRRKAKPFQSAMSMLNLYINRAGRTLPASRRRVLERAKQELRVVIGRAE